MLFNYNLFMFITSFSFIISFIYKRSFVISHNITHSTVARNYPKQPKNPKVSEYSLYILVYIGLHSETSGNLHGVPKSVFIWNRQVL